MQEGRSGKETRQPQFTKYPIEIGSFLYGKDTDVYLPEEAADIATAIAKALKIPVLRRPFQEFGERAATVSGLYAIGIGFLVEHGLHMDIHYFSEREVHDNIMEAAKPLDDAEWGVHGRGIGGLTTGTFFTTVSTDTVDSAIEDFKEGRQVEIIPLHDSPLQGVVVLRVGPKAVIPSS